MQQTRINKFLAETGSCSRRQADKLIEGGEVTINNKTAKLGDKVSTSDTIKINGKTVIKETKKIYIAFHKPFGVITTTDQNSENNIMEYFKDIPQRIYPVGRLDVESSGLILLTNDGDLVNTILKSKHNQEKEYLVTLDKPITDEAIKKLETGIFLDGRNTLSAKVKKRNPHQISITIIQGINRQIRRMCEAVGYEIKVLKRIRIAGITLNEISRGKWRHLTPEEIKRLTNKA